MKYLWLLLAEIQARMRFRPTAPEGSAQHFHEQMEAAMEILTPRLMSMPKGISERALAAALAMQLIAALSKVIADGDLTSEEAQKFVLHISHLEFKESELLRTDD